MAIVGVVSLAYLGLRKASEREMAQQAQQVQEEAVPVTPTDLGNGVYYFPLTGEAYIQALVKFYEGNGKHCDLQGTTEELAGDGYDHRARYTRITGFILHCHELPGIYAQGDTRE
jgi:hypothetical protein